MTWLLPGAIYKDARRAGRKDWCAHGSAAMHRPIMPKYGMQASSVGVRVELSNADAAALVRAGAQHRDNSEGRNGDRRHRSGAVDGGTAWTMPGTSRGEAHYVGNSAVLPEYKASRPARARSTAPTARRRRAGRSHAGRGRESRRGGEENSPHGGRDRTRARYGASLRGA
ncbi:hypothetical protein OH77DRAFT_1421702 [Trametes cingulata]|nr:hypothetical protein OH77DRAFT_1421702 [Trametes cingulata]